MNRMLIAALALTAPILGTPAAAQEFIESKVDIAFNRYYDTEEVYGYLAALAEAYPDLVELVQIGTSGQGRPLWLAIVNGAGRHDAKPAMYIDGNIHANEIQCAEVVVYTLWYLTKGYGVNAEITRLLDTYSFYLVPIVNPDSRAYFFRDPATPHFPRWNQRPVDNDRDGLVDEDPFDDLDGDGSITTMWKRDPAGRWARDPDDPRIFTRVAADERGGWTRLGSEGVDNDGDGRINEDGPGGDDMNRNWPSDWKPNYVQFGAGTYPFNNPETRSIGEFVLAHPNIAAFQSYHNTGGMMLRGPGASYQGKAYPASDVRVYDEIGRVGEDLLPYYRYLVVYKDLYRVHGGEVNWAAEGLGIISFTNELWTAGKYFQRDKNRPDPELMWLWRDRVDFGATFKDYTEIEHPQHGTVLVGGLNKWSSRSTPTFMLEEECHRNFAFTMFHADQMPVLDFGRVEAVDLGAGLWQITAEVINDRLIPTRTARARQQRIGRNDLFLCDADVVAGGTLRSWDDDAIRESRHEPARLQIPDGVPGHGRTTARFYVVGDAGDVVTLSYSAEKAADVARTVILGE